LDSGNFYSDVNITKYEDEYYLISDMINVRVGVGWEKRIFEMLHLCDTFNGVKQFLEEKVKKEK
jgi:hypothetical protein